MTTDHELLKLAAKAAGIIGEWERDAAFVQERWRFMLPYSNHGMMTAHEWNPLTDDGDALRLAVKLRLTIDTGGIVPARQKTFVGGADGYLADEPHNSDPYAATRRAIVRAAAEIGRAAP